MPFYEFSQNNSGGHFTVDEILCHRLVIEAKDNDHAVQIAEGLGCYWNGVSEGMDCGCCGDRWYDSENVIELPSTRPVEVYEFKGSDTKQLWLEKYGSFPIETEPTTDTRKTVGVVKLETIEQYCQFVSTAYGWTTPDTRLFLLDGTVKEFFKYLRV